jgi:hypothetical protein
VRRDSHRGDAPLARHGVREPDHVSIGVILVGERARHQLQAHRLQPVRVEEGARHLGARDARVVGHGAVALEHTLHPCPGGEAQQQRHDEQQPQKRDGVHSETPTGRATNHARPET